MGNKAESGRRISNFSKTLSEVSKKGMSKMPPFTDDELTTIRELFGKLQNKNNSSIEPEKLDEVTWLRILPIYSRVRQLAEEQLLKSNIRRLNFEMFAQILSVFHISTSLEDKLKYLFRIYDWDKDYKLGVDDLTKSLRLLLVSDPNSRSNIYTDKDLQELAERYLVKHGEKGFIKPERFRELIPESEAMLMMTVMFE